VILRTFGRPMVGAVLRSPELEFVAVLKAGVEPENAASRRCLEAAGFRLRVTEPDFEVMLYYSARRAAKFAQIPHGHQRRRPGEPTSSTLTDPTGDSSCGARSTRLLAVANRWQNTSGGSLASSQKAPK
jgi:hypothetical protein